jgi:thiol-disulfide isomerase/thioredoxin
MSVAATAYTSLVGQPCPDGLRLVHTLTGEATTLEDLRRSHPSQYTVLDFGATWCVNCPASVDALEALAAEWQSDLVSFIIINVDSLSLARAEIAAHGWARGAARHVHVTDADKSCSAYKSFGVRYLPHCVLLDRDGTVLRNFADFSANNCGALLRQLLARTAATAVDPPAATTVTDPVPAPQTLLELSHQLIQRLGPQFTNCR